MLFVPFRGLDLLEASQSSSSSSGATITASGSTHTKGNWSQVLAATSFEAFGIAVFVNNVGAATTNARVLVDIGLGANPNERVLIPDLDAGNAADWAAAPNGGHFYYFPLYIAAGERISARCQASTASDTVAVVVWLVGGRGGAAPWCGQRVTAYGVDSANSRGTAITPGSTSAYGTAVQLAASTSNPIRALQIGMDTGTDTSGTSMRGMLRLGLGATPNYFVEHLPIGESTTVESMDIRMANLILSQMTFNLPAGSDLRASAMVSGTGEARSLIVYGVD